MVSLSFLFSCFRALAIVKNKVIIWCQTFECMIVGISQSGVMAACDFYSWWRWWSDTLWVTLIRIWLLIAMLPSKCFVEFYLQSHRCLLAFEDIFFEYNYAGEVHQNFRDCIHVFCHYVSYCGGWSALCQVFVQWPYLFSIYSHTLIAVTR
jgi:hypothetical protein